MAKLAELADVQRLITIDDSEHDYVLLQIEEASDLVEGYCKRSFTHPIPGAVARVVARMVARALGAEESSIPEHTTQLTSTAGPFSRNISFSSGSTEGGVWLSRSDKTKLRRWRGGAFTIDT